MIDNKIDQQLERFSSAVAHASPDPLPLTEPSRRQRFKKPVLAIASGFVVVVLTLGISAVVVTWTRSADTKQQPAASTDGLDVDIGADSEWTDQEVSDAISIWVNQLGLNQDDPEIWKNRLSRICGTGDAAGQRTGEMNNIAAEFVAEDADVSVRADGQLPTAEEAAESLWIIASSPTCGDPTEPADVPRARQGAYDPGALMRPDLMLLRPAVVEPGNTVSVFFPDERIRGIHFVLESVNDDGAGKVVFIPEFHLISDWGGDHEPLSYTIEEMRDVEVADIGIVGPGPDVVTIPAEVLPGEYRICTANSSINICTPLAIEIYE